MADNDIREIYQRLNTIERKQDALLAKLDERDKSCAARHVAVDAVCATATELKGAWRVLVVISAVAGAVAGKAAEMLLGRS